MEVEEKRVKDKERNSCIILWEMNSLPAMEIKIGNDEREKRLSSECEEDYNEIKKEEFLWQVKGLPNDK